MSNKITSASDIINSIGISIQDGHYRQPVKIELPKDIEIAKHVLRENLEHFTYILRGLGITVQNIDTSNIDHINQMDGSLHVSGTLQIKTNSSSLDHAIKHYREMVDIVSLYKENEKLRNENEALKELYDDYEASVELYKDTNKSEEIVKSNSNY